MSSSLPRATVACLHLPSSSLLILSSTVFPAVLSLSLSLCLRLILSIVVSSFLQLSPTLFFLLSLFIFSPSFHLPLLVFLSLYPSLLPFFSFSSSHHLHFYSSSLLSLLLLPCNYSSLIFSFSSSFLLSSLFLYCLFSSSLLPSLSCFPSLSFCSSLLHIISTLPLPLFSSSPPLSLSPHTHSSHSPLPLIFLSFCSFLLSPSTSHPLCSDKG